MGRYMASDRKSGDSNKKDAQTLLMEIFGNASETVRGIAYSTRGMTEAQAKDMMNTEITRPALTLVGMTTPAALYDAIGAMDVRDGFLNRFIIVESEIGRQRRRRGIHKAPIPDEIIKWAREHAKAHGGGEDEEHQEISDPTFVAPPVIVPFTQAALDRIDEIGAELDAEMDEAEPYGMEELFGRTGEIAQRLSLIIARSERSNKVEVSHINWAWNYVRFYHRRMVGMFKTNLGKSVNETIAEEVFAFVKRQGSKGASSGDIGTHVRSFRALDTRGRDEILVRVQHDFGVKHIESDNKRGPKSKRYFVPKS
jgi:hypothetical protein